MSLRTGQTVSTGETVPRPPVSTDPDSVLSRVPRIAVCDPRTKLLALLVVNAVVYAAKTTETIILGALIVGMLLLTQRDRRPFVIYATIFGVSASLTYFLPLVWHGGGAVAVVTLTYWIVRFSVTIGFFVFFFLSTGVGELVAALVAIRAPRFLVIPVAVVMRFIPTVWEELKAITEAMRLRHVVSGAGDVVLHPVRVSEYILVPLMVSVTRIADELSAAALIRGLGRSSRPTSLLVLRFGVWDAALLAATATLVWLHVSGWTVK